MHKRPCRQALLGTTNCKIAPRLTTKGPRRLGFKDRSACSRKSQASAEYASPAEISPSPLDDDGVTPDRLTVLARPEAQDVRFIGSAEAGRERRGSQVADPELPDDRLRRDHPRVDRLRVRVACDHPGRPFGTPTWGDHRAGAR